MRIARNGMKVIFPVFLVSFVMVILSVYFRSTVIVALFWFFLVLLGFLIYFFRDPERIIPEGEGIIVSPADGKVMAVESLKSSFCGDSVRVSIFMSLFNVHVNRVPYSGVVENVEYRPGQFRPAYRGGVEKTNESNTIYIESGELKLIVKQIAGVIARRIVSYVGKGDRVVRGQRFGMIMFGSRVDLILPSRVKLRVGVGQKVKAGETIVGEVD